MARRRKVEEFEADLYKVPLPRFWRIEKGELERKAYDDGEEKLEICFRGLPGPDGGLARVLINGEPVCEIQVREGQGRQVLSSTAGEAIPKVGSGSLAEIEYQGQIVLRGLFERD
jgi:hypothetical protein